MTDAVRIPVGQPGRIVVSALFRKALGIAAGDELILRLEDNELRITTKQRHIQRGHECTCRYVQFGRSAVEELLAERRGEVRASRSTF